MYGAIIGDMAGSLYEFSNIKYKPADILPHDCFFTDDTVMTIAVAETLLDEKGAPTLVRNMRKWAKRYPGRGYGGMFARWLEDESMGAYNSFGNGSAMRISAVGWLYETLATTRQMARLVTEVTHNHPEGIKGAEAVASAVFIAREGYSKEHIKMYIEDEFGYDLSRTCDEIRPTYYFNETCQETVPEAIIAFLESENFEDCIKLAVSLGGDSDTLAAIAGSIAEAYYGVSDRLVERCRWRLPMDMLEVIDEFETRRITR